MEYVDYYVYWFLPTTSIELVVLFVLTLFWYISGGTKHSKRF